MGTASTEQAPNMYHNSFRLFLSSGGAVHSFLLQEPEKKQCRPEIDRGDDGGESRTTQATK